MTLDLYSGFGTGLVAVAPLAAFDGAWGLGIMCLLAGGVLVWMAFRKEEA